MDSKTIEDEDVPEGITIEDISDNPLIKRFQEHTLYYGDGFIRVQPYNQVFPNVMKDYLKRIENFHVREDDIWIASFPKCGTTWTQEMVWCLMNNVDTEKAKRTVLDERVAFFEIVGIVPLKNRIPDSLTTVDNLPSPRIMKTHLSYDMLPKECAGKKIIYVIRNPRDVCVSFYNHLKIIDAYSDTFENFAELFLNDICCYYTPFFTNVLSYWNRRHMLNILFITYEEMIENLSSVIRKVAEFLGKDINDEDVKNLETHLSFANMKENPAVNKQGFLDVLTHVHREEYGVSAPEKKEFIRKGKIGNWKEHFGDDLLEKFKRWEEDGLKDTDLKFCYE